MKPWLIMFALQLHGQPEVQWLPAALEALWAWELKWGYSDKPKIANNDITINGFVAGPMVGYCIAGVKYCEVLEREGNRLLVQRARSTAVRSVGTFVESEYARHADWTVSRERPSQWFKLRIHSKRTNILNGDSTRLREHILNEFRTTGTLTFAW